MYVKLLYLIWNKLYLLIHFPLFYFSYFIPVYLMFFLNVFFMLMKLVDCNSIKTSIHKTLFNKLIVTANSIPNNIIKDMYIFYINNKLNKPFFFIKNDSLYLQWLTTIITTTTLLWQMSCSDIVVTKVIDMSCPDIFVVAKAIDMSWPDVIVVANFMDMSCPDIIVMTNVMYVMFWHYFGDKCYGCHVLTLLWW